MPGRRHRHQAGQQMVCVCSSLGRALREVRMGRKRRNPPFPSPALVRGRRGRGESPPALLQNLRFAIHQSPRVCPQNAHRMPKKPTKALRCRLVMRARPMSLRESHQKADTAVDATSQHVFATSPQRPPRVREVLVWKERETRQPNQRFSNKIAHVCSRPWFSINPEAVVCPQEPEQGMRKAPRDDTQCSSFPTG